jgi:hypothetical protein
MENMSWQENNKREETLPSAFPKKAMQQKTNQDASSFEREGVTSAQLGCYVRTSLFPVFKFPFSDEDFKIDGKLYQHYVKLCSPLVGHMLMGNAKNDYIKMLWGKIHQAPAREQTEYSDPSDVASILM